MAIDEEPIRMIEFAARRLGRLSDRFVYVGGVVTSLLVTRIPPPRPRFTKDVDVIVEVATRTDFYDLEDHLRAAGFVNDKSDGAPICRWIVDGLIVDVMPTDERFLLFANKWYRAAAANALRRRIAPDVDVQYINAPYFVATKLDAFFDRGRGDYMMSRDVEDIISILDGRAELVEELADALEDVQNFVATSFGNLLSDIRFIDSISAHLLPDAGSQARRPMILERMRAIAALAR